MFRIHARDRRNCALIALVASAQKPKDGEWPSYAADLAGTRYRPLDQINASNFSKLEIAWRFKTDSIGNRPEYKLEGTPLMVNGVVYATAGSRRAAIALDAATGELLWVHGEHEGERGAAAPRQLSGRGLAYWTDGKQERILYVTPGYRLICLDAKTGQPVASFGKNGAVDLKLDDDQTIHAGPDDGRDRPAIGAGRGEGYHHHRRGIPRRHDAEEHAQQQRLRARLRRANGQAPVDFPYDSARRASPDTTPGKKGRPSTRATPAYGRRSPSMSSSGWCICRWNRPQAIITAAIARATISMARAWSAWT